MPPKKKVEIAKGVKVPIRYVPKGLTPADRKKQVKSILEKKDRPKIKSFQSKRSPFIIKFEKKYKKKITDTKWIDKNILKKKGQEEVLSKGRGAYYSSGSRPNQTAESWALPRLASVIVGGPARRIDQKIWDKYSVRKGGAIKIDWINKNKDDIKKKDLDTWKEHTRHHTIKHLKDMMKDYKNGKSFNETHKLALQRVGK